MKVLKRILLFLLLLVIAIAVVGFFLPSKYRVERTVVIKAQPAAIYPLVAQLNRWPEWSAWTTNLDPTATFQYSGPASGVGAVSSWDGKKLGNGTMKITAAEPQTGIDYDLSFDHGQYVSRGAIKFEASGDGTKIVWSDEGDLGGNPFSRYFGLVLDRMIGPDFQTGLDNLKGKLEAK